jgi:hypothetical protein
MKDGAVVVAASSFASSNVLGGHYRSAAAIAELLSDEHEIILLNPGTRPSPVMVVNGLETVFLEGSPERPAALRRRIMRLMDDRSVKAVLAFDQKVGELMRPLARRRGVGFILVKPGGGKPRLYYPRAEHNIVFTSADETWLADRNPSSCHVALAAGRIYAPSQDLDAQTALRKEIDLLESEVAIVRIGRLHEHYAATNRAALALAKRMRSEGLPARLVMIGTAQSPAEYDALMALKGREDAILCDERFTSQASRLLGMFNFNVGTGRGFMEGAAMGQVMFCASQDPSHELPLLVTEDNVSGFFDENFSPRVKADVSPEENARRVVAMAYDADIQNVLSMSALGWYERMFSAETSRRVYLEMIARAAEAPERLSVDHLKSEVHLRFSVVLDRVRKRLHG